MSFSLGICYWPLFPDCAEVGQGLITHPCCLVLVTYYTLRLTQWTYISCRDVYIQGQVWYRSVRYSWFCKVYSFFRHILEIKCKQVSMCTNIDLYTHIKKKIYIYRLYIHPISMLVYPYHLRSGRDAPPGHWRRGVAGGGAESPQGHQRRGMTSGRVCVDGWTEVQVHKIANNMHAGYINVYSVYQLYRYNIYIYIFRYTYIYVFLL